jgi:hypothetical protein
MLYPQTQVNLLQPEDLTKLVPQRGHVLLTAAVRAASTVLRSERISGS